MSHSDFDHFLANVDALSPDQVRHLLRELQIRMRATPNLQAQTPIHEKQESEQTAFDVASGAGLIGCIEGAPRSPTDLSTNPVHMKGFGRE